MEVKDEHGQTILDIVNGSRNFTQIAQTISKGHRFLQHEFFTLCTEYIRTMSEKDDNQFDDRNEYAVKMSRHLKKAMDEFKYD